MDKDFTSIFQSKLASDGFIKVTENSVKTLSSKDKAVLNRKGNELFNQGDVNSARRIFLATGYSDGLTRVGDYYLKLGDELTALKHYWLARNKHKAAPIIQKMANIVSVLIQDKD